MCEIWHNTGYEVILYNDPKEENASDFEQRAIVSFEPLNKKRDILICFRSPNPRAAIAKGLKVWWSTDQYTTGEFDQFGPLMDKIVCISIFHKNFFNTTYQIDNAEVIDLPVRIHDFAYMDLEKIPNSFIFTSVPDRGLMVLKDIWHIVRQKVPDASLVITSDYRLWGADGPRNELHRAKWIGQSGINFVGAVPRIELLDYLAKSEIMPYPCWYEELHCLAVSEAQCMGVYPITSAVGALSTTTMGTQISGHPMDRDFQQRFAECVVETSLNKEELQLKRKKLVKDARERFDPLNIRKQWDKVFEI
jgi:glycosyltransferase involved in cell wall biosynthesis